MYVGKVVNPIKEITEADDDKAHVDANAVPQIQFSHSDDTHNFMVDKILKQNEGITYSLFTEEAPADDEGETPPQEPASGDEGAPATAQVAKPKPLRHILVPEVVHEPKIHFYTVPRLGSYLAIKLEYNTCLFQEAFDEATADYAVVNQKRAELEKEQKEYADQQEEQKAEKAEAGETYVPEDKKWPAYSYKEFKQKKVQYVVCLNTLGQDRCYSTEMKNQVLDIVKAYRDQWEELEKNNLRSDIKAKFER